MAGLFQDLRYGARMLAKNPGFTAVAVITLALGIGANTAIFSVVHATLLRPFPFQDPDRLMLVFTTRPAIFGEPPRYDGAWSYPKYQTFRRHQQAFDDVAVYYGSTYNLTGVDQAERVIGEVVSATYFPVLGVRAHLGRTFSPEEDATPEVNRAAVLGYGLWQRAFGADRNVIGKIVTLDNNSYLIVGVLPPEFRGLTGRAEIWVPTMTLSAQQLAERWGHRFQLVARRKPGITDTQAKSIVAILGRRVDEEHPDPRGFRGWGANARTINEVRVDRDLRTAVLVLFGAVSFVVLIACVNVASLLLARGGARRREIAVRLAIGASRGRIVRLLLTESLLLALIGAAAGLILAQWGASALSALNPASNPFGRMAGLTIIGLSSIRIDGTALLFTFAVALLTGVLFGLAPALQASRQELTDALKADGSAARGFANLRALTGRNILVLTEVAMAFVVLVGAGLMIKSFGKLLATDAGIDPDSVLTSRINLSSGQYTPEASLAFFEQLQARIAGVPGVESVGIADCPPLAGRCSGTAIRFRDRPEVPKGSEPEVGVHWVSGDCFKTLKIPLLRGRLFTPQDRQGAPKVVLISETAARAFWPGEDPLGKPIALGQGGFQDRAEIVGIVGDVRYRGMDTPPSPEVYLSYQQSRRNDGTIFIRTTGDPLTLVAALRQEVKALNKDLPLYDIKTMSERAGDATARMRFNAMLLAIFASIAALLAAVGIYGVTSYAVAQRTREVGIRIALGAEPRDVLALVVRGAAMFILPGIAIGLVAAFAVTRVLTRLLYQVKPSDPATYVILALALGALALLASYIPARRAAKIDPMAALRYE